jgi:nicotinamidase-related amidase
MNQPARLDANAALLLIDLQQGIHHPKLGRRNQPDAEERIGELLVCWRRTARPVVHVRHVSRDPDSVFWPGQPGALFQAAFMPRASEQVVEKQVPDAFVATGLERRLRERGIAQLVIAGVITNNSVESTARSAGNLGFETVVASDGAFTFDRCDLAGRLWRAEEIHALSLSNLAMDYARIMTTAEIVGLAEEARRGEG